MAENLQPVTVAGVLAGVILIAMMLVAATGDVTGRLGAVLLAALSVVWVFTNKPMGGAVVLTLSDDRGVTMADLVGLTALMLAAWRYLLSRERRRRWEAVRRSRT